MSDPFQYITFPPSGKGPGLLVLHPWWGLNDFIKDFCQRLSREGFVVLAPDLYHGKIAKTIPEAEALRGKMKRAQAQAEMLAALSALQAQATPIGVIGFSLGAYFALWLAGQQPQAFRSVTLFYGSGGKIDFNTSQAAFLGHFAETDPYESSAAVKKMEKEIHKAGRPVQFYTYPGTGHWFFESDRPEAFNPAAAELAWKRTLEFLQKEMIS